MSNRLADRLIAARRRRFVGRSEELARFQSALVADELPFQLLYVYGPGGVGKTTLLSEFGHVAEAAGLAVLRLDGRSLEPVPAAFTAALRAALDLPPDASVPDVLAARPGRSLIVIDGYDHLAPLDDWLRDTFLPQLPDNLLLVVGDRSAPCSGWQTDPGWQTLIRTLALRNLSPEESRAYLVRREVPLAEHQKVLDFTHGHPLALSMVADVLDQRPGQSFEPEAAPDVVKTLLEQFVQKVPGPAHRAALEACAQVRIVNEALLSEMLAMPEVHELFDWLRGLSFIEAQPAGIFPHDLAREALAADLRWRNPDWCSELHRRARAYYTTRLNQSRDPVQAQRILLDYVYLHRDNALVRPFLEWQSGGAGVLVDSARPDDLPLLVDMVRRQEGEESARLVETWFKAGSGWLLLRAPAGAPLGFVLMLQLQQAPAALVQADPGAAAAWRYLQARTPLRAGEVATLFRFWMAQDTYQAVSPVQSLIFVHMVRHYLTTPGLAFTFLPSAEPEFWAPMFAYADLMRLPECDFEVGGRRYGVYGHDWRAMPPMAWLALLAERETAAAPAAGAPARVSEPLLVLSQDEFNQAVRDALRDFARPDLLRANPLLRSRMIAERAGAQAAPAERVTCLQTLLKDAGEALQASPREAKLYRAVQHTYFQPLATQEQVAELLDLPFSTFRRHLKAGMTRVAETLWDREIGAAAE
ncbi:MAG: AAA family ATPase [Anaerolineales bacterium]